MRRSRAVIFRTALLCCSIAVSGCAPWIEGGIYYDEALCGIAFACPSNRPPDQGRRGDREDAGDTAQGLDDSSPPTDPLPDGF